MRIWVQISAREQICFEISATPAPPIANLHVAMMSTLTEHCPWEDDTVRERTGPPAVIYKCPEGKKMKSLAHVIPMVALRLA